MDIELRHLRYFVAVAEERSFTKAADRLRVGQPAVSRTVQQLERRLGVRLLARGTRLVEPTRAGLAALDHARELLAGLDDLVQEARGTSRGLEGELNLGLVHDVHHVVAELVTGYRRHHPGVTVTLWVGSRRDVLNEVDKGGTDVMLTWGDPPAADRHPRRVVSWDEVLLAVPSADGLATRRRVPVAALAARDVLVPDPAGAHDFHDVLLAAVVRPAAARAVVVPMVDSGQEATLRAAAAGSGIAPVSAALFRRHRRPGLVARPLDPPLRIPVTMLWRAEGGPVVRAFLAESAPSPGGPAPQRG